METPFFIGLLLLAAGLAVFIVLPYLNAIVLAATLAILFHPVYRGLRRVLPGHEALASFIAVCIALVVIVTPLVLFGLQIVKEAQGLYGQFASGENWPALSFMRAQIEKTAPWVNLDFSQYLRQMLQAVLANLGAAISGLANIAGILFLTFFSLYYFLKDSGKIRDAVIKISPLSHGHTEEILTKLYSMANSVIKGSLVVAIAQGALVGIGFVLFGLSNPVLWGSVAVIAALIPVAGTALIVVPAAALLAFSGHLVQSVGFIIWGFVIVGLVDNFLRPKLIERNVKIHPLLVLLSVLGGLSVFGVMGFVLGPLILSLLLTLVEIYPSLILERG